MKHSNALVDSDQIVDSAFCNKVLETKTNDSTTSGVAKGAGVQGDMSYVSFQDSIQLSLMEALAQKSI